MLKTAALILLTGTCLIAAPNPAFTADPSEKPRWTTVAIVPDAAAQATGVPALLTAELSKRGDIQLVDRADLRRVLGELKLSAITAVSDRLRLGNLLKADMLVLLSVTTNGSKRFLRLTICESQHGARLSDSQIALSTGSPKGTLDPGIDSVVQNCVENVDRTRQQFRDGVRTLVTVLPFISRNPDEKHDSLQTGLASLLQTSLVTIPGVAVLEIEEAAAIRKEMEISQPGAVRDGVFPLLIDGEFRIKEAGGTKKVWLHLTLRDGNRIVRELSRENQSYDDTLAELLDRAGRQLLNIETARAGQPLSRDAIFAALSKRADRLSATNAPRLALPVREAAILIQPDSFQQRVAAIHDYVSMRRAAKPTDRFRSTQASAQQLDSVSVDQAFVIEAELSHMRRAMLHLEFLVRNRLVNPGEAAWLLEGISQHSLNLKELVVQKPEINGRTVWEESFWGIVDTYARLDPDLRVGKLSARIRDVPPAPRKSALLGQEDALDLWTAQAQFDRFLNVARFHLNGGPARIGPSGTADHTWVLQAFERLLTSVPANDFPSVSIVRTITVHFPARRKRGTFTVSQLREFYERLQKTSVVNRHYATWGLIELDQDQPEVDRETVRKRVEQQVTELRTLLGDEPTARYGLHRAPYGEVVSAIRSRLRVTPGSTSPGKMTRLPPANYLKYREGRIHRGAARKPNDKVQFLPVGIAAPWFDIIQCNETLDILWNFGAVAVMQAPGEVSTIFTVNLSTNDYIQHIAWDSKNVWIATVQSGIFVVSPEGKQLAAFEPDNASSDDPSTNNPSDNIRKGEASDTATPLPQYVRNYKHTFRSAYATVRERSRNNTFGLHPRTLWLHTVGAGRCFVIGIYGQDGRSWMLELSLPHADSDRPLISDLFHIARKTSVNPSAPDSLADPEVLFAPRWTETVEHAGRTLILAGRSPVGKGRSIERPPLAIDVESHEVTAFVWPELPVGTRNYPVFLSDSHILFQGFRGVHGFNHEDGVWLKHKFLRFPQSHPIVRAELRKLNQRVYFVGQSWAEVDAGKSTITTFGENNVPIHCQFEHYADSAHFGLVAWNRGDQLYRIILDPAKDSATDNSFFFIPTEHRESHIVAVQRLRSLGAGVSTRWSEGPRFGAAKRLFDWRMTVTFTPEWTGDDSELSALSSIYNLDHVVVDGPKPTDAGMPFITKLERLQSLKLSDTSITNEGLAGVATLRYLKTLTLAPQPGNNRLSNAGLGRLKPLKALQRLTIHGPGFTADAIPILQTMEIGV